MILERVAKSPRDSKGMTFGKTNTTGGLQSNEPNWDLVSGICRKRSP